MNRAVFPLLLAVPLACVALATPPTVYAQQARKPAPPAPKRPSAGGPIVLGTTQMPGDFGKIGQTYTVGKATPLNFTLDSVRYAADRFTVAGSTWAPKADEKLMILRYTIHNPLPREQRHYWADLRFTVVDANDTNHEAIQAVRRAGVTGAAFDQSLKPAQKVQMECALLVPADGEVPKLIVQREKDAPVIRYDLRGKAAPLPAPIADPADASGATARRDAPYKAGEVAPLATFDLRLDSFTYTDEPLNRRLLQPGYRNAVATFTLKNSSGRDSRYYWGYFEVIGRDADGEKVPYTQALLKASRDESVDATLAVGEEARVRFYFPVPEKSDAKTISIREGREGRWATFDLSAPAGQ